MSHLARIMGIESEKGLRMSRKSKRCSQRDAEDLSSALRVVRGQPPGVNEAFTEPAVLSHQVRPVAAASPRCAVGVHEALREQPDAVVRLADTYGWVIIGCDESVVITHHIGVTSRHHTSRVDSTPIPRRQPARAADNLVHRPTTGRLAAASIR
jgi:hypothetical protein